MPEAEIPAYIALGSNIEPERNLLRCLELLEEIPQTRVVARSSWYRTSPWGLESQAEFINAAVGLVTRLGALELLRETQAIEQRLARNRAIKNGPRTIDIDLLLLGAEVRSEEDLTLPHPGLLVRDFMLVPLIEIAPQAIHPLRQRPVSELAGEIQFRQILGLAPTPADLKPDT